MLASSGSRRASGTSRTSGSASDGAAAGGRSRRRRRRRRATFALAKAHVFEPSAPAAAPAGPATSARRDGLRARSARAATARPGRGRRRPGARRERARCGHGRRRSSQQGRGVMPAGLVSGPGRGGRRRLRRLDLQPRRLGSAAWRSRPGSSVCSSRRRSSSRARRPTTPTSCTSRSRTRASTGYGEAAPVERYDESPQSALAFVEEHGQLVGDDPFALEDIGERLAAIAGEQAAKSALDAALHDLQGKLLGVPAARLLGLPRAGPPTSWTIWLGDPDDMARRAESARRRTGGSS